MEKKHKYFSMKIVNEESFTELQALAKEQRRSVGNMIFCIVDDHLKALKKEKLKEY